MLSQADRDSWRKLFAAEVDVLTRILQAFKEKRYLPPEFQVAFPECKQINAAFNAKEKTIYMCQEIMVEFAKFANKLHPDDPQEWYSSALGMTLFVFMHELGHALIAYNNYPVLGSEEDAVDRFAAVIAVSLGEEEGIDIGEHMIIATALWYKEMGKNSELKAYWDEHPLNEQRYFTFICLLYGSNPAKYESITLLTGLPGARRRSCPAEYQQAKRAWESMLTR